MENKLRKLFEYQKFEQNKDLQNIINESLQYETTTVLSDEMLGAVAGGQNQPENKQEDNKTEKN